MKIWRVHIRPKDREANVDPFDVCIRQGVIGIGWRVSRKPANKDEYWTLGEQEYRDVRRTGWSRAAKAIGYKMSIGDIVWTRDSFGIYYIGQITGEWEYRDSPENLKADIINVRPCKLYRVGASVAGKIVNSFRSSATIQQIHDSTVELFSVYVFNKVSDTALPLPPIREPNIFSLLSDVDLEDVVSLFLQKKRGLLFIPSSRARQNDTIFYEYQLVNPTDGQPVFVQVKSGTVTLDPRNYYAFPHQIYLFSPAGYDAQSEREHVVCLDRDEIEDFVTSSRNFMPLNISAWLDLAEELSDIGRRREK